MYVNGSGLRAQNMLIILAELSEHLHGVEVRISTCRKNLDFIIFWGGLIGRAEFALLPSIQRVFDVSSKSNVRFL